MTIKKNFACLDFLSKIYSPTQIIAKLSSLARPLVFTNGVFDILHRGHVSYLSQARSIGGSLIVALNTDFSVHKLGKGEGRPINPLQDRVAVIAALQSVDLTTWFEEATPIHIIKLIHPDIIVKGGDYNMNNLPETQLVRSWGGQAITIPFMQNFSTTSIVQKIQASLQQG